ncbi:MAG: TonB family protein [Terriglobales bacterium]
MSETWKKWEGHTVDGRFLLQSYLGGSDHSAVFLTRRDAVDSAQAAIKLIAADAADAEKQLLRWKKIGGLNHPNLIRIFEAGLCNFDGTALLYVVEEYAEENLAQILPERALTADEARALLPPLVQALQYAHENGWGHGHIRPSNILAIADQVKLSSDTLTQSGETGRGASATSDYAPPEAATGAASAPADVWQLGMTLVEVLTQRLPSWGRAHPSLPQIPAAIPQPLRAIAEHCLQVEPANRWTLGQIRDCSEGGQPAAISTQNAAGITVPALSAAPRQSSKWPHWLVATAVVLAIVFFFARPKPANPPAKIPTTQAQSNTATDTTQSPPQPEPKPNPIATAGATPAAGGNEDQSANAHPANHANESGIVRQVMPEVSPVARRSIQGKIKVRVRVEVNSAGNVAKATLESAGPSKYFSRIALAAAREWKFSPLPGDQAGAREWKLQFAFTRARTEVSAVRGKR